MTENRAAASAKTAKPFTGAGSSFDRPAADGTAAVREFAQQGAAYAKDMHEKTQAAAADTKKILEQAYATATKGAAEFNLQWLEMVRANTNAAFDFARAVAAVKSPSEFFELSAAHARQQVETCSEQSQQLTALAQKVTTEAVKPLQSGVTSAFNKVA